MLKKDLIKYVEQLTDKQVKTAQKLNEIVKSGGFDVVLSNQIWLMASIINDLSRLISKLE